VALRHIFSQKEALKEFLEAEELYTSALARAEIRRSLDRVRLQRRLEARSYQALLDNFQQLEDRFRYIEVTPFLLEAAGDPQAAPLGALDALHLVTAVQWARQNPGPWVFLTHDQQQGAAARAMGLPVLGLE
jgi:predicted nucleic acid-binding protein